MASAGDRTAGRPSPRRIKRRVAARTHRFFAATAPGLETLCKAELSRLPLSTADAEEVPGGVSFSGRLADLYLANLHLRTANRILMRITEFPAESFRALQRQLGRVDWPLFLPSGVAPPVRVSTRHCRLYHSEAVALRVKEHLKSVLGASGDKEAAPDDPLLSTVYLRGEKDRFLVSVDSSGELLHRRGVKPHAAAAPLRETLAAAILSWAGFDSSRPMIDPMCGSGTFSLEAAMITAGLPAGWFRRFSFETWPAFRPRQWVHLRREAETRFRLPETARIFAGDRGAGLLDDLRKALIRCGLERAVSLFAADFFDLQPDRCRTAPGLVVLNPPYGKRMEAGEVRVAGRIFQHLKDAFEGWRIALAAPPKQIGPVPFPHRKRRLSHGGLALTLVTGRIPPGR